MMTADGHFTPNRSYYIPREREREREREHRKPQRQYLLERIKFSLSAPTAADATRRAASTIHLSSSASSGTLYGETGRLPSSADSLLVHSLVRAKYDRSARICNFHEKHRVAGQVMNATVLCSYRVTRQD